jgi:phosphoribosylanthranilate isomerase
MARAKICGINDAVAIDAAVDAGADWIGFVFFPPSPRFVTPSAAKVLAARHMRRPPVVGLFVNPTDAAIAEALDDVSLDILQLYGAEADLPRLRAHFGLPIWRPVGVTGAPDLPPAMDGADALLLEATPPPDATRPGGNARRFEWALTLGWSAPGPWILAGGLDPDNVAEAIRLSGANAVDVSSGVEKVKGIKDAALIHAFVRRAHDA